MNWKNWAGNVTAEPKKICVADCEADLVDIVSEARENKQKIRAVGTGHSFSAICATDDILVSLADQEECTVSSDGIATIWAGSKIGSAAAALWDQGYSFENQGDIDVQSLAGALCTGTHGTGKQFGSFSAKATAMRLVTAEGVVREINGEQDTDLLRAAALSVGMLGLLSEVKLQVSPHYHLREETQIVDVDVCFETYDALSVAHRNVEFYWLPGFDKCVVKTIDIADDTILEDNTAELPPPGTVERYLRPVRANKAYLVYRNIRTVPFLEMEYSVPIEAGLACMSDIRHLMQNKFPEMSWVTEYRTQAADSLMLSPAYKRSVAAISVHDHPDGGQKSEKYFRACEEIFVAYDGRPHWGKLCFLSPRQRADLFPEFESFSRIRRQFDPDGLFLNKFLQPLFV